MYFVYVYIYAVYVVHMYFKIGDGMNGNYETWVNFMETPIYP